MVAARMKGVLALAALILCSSPAFGVCLNGYPTISEEYGNSDVVLVGRVVAHRETLSSGDGYFLDGDTYIVSPLRVLKGTVGSIVDVFSENSSGRFPMKMKQEYLLFVYEFHGRLMVDNCGNSDLMPHAKNALARTAALAVQGFPSQVVLKAFHNADPAISWDIGSAKTADFDCDEKADTVMIGVKEGQVVVGVVWGKLNKQPAILSFPTGTNTQNGFSEQAKTINTYAVDCKDGTGRTLPGCQIIPACKAFSISDDDSDLFHFYWDSSHGGLRWWRE